MTESTKALAIAAGLAGVAGAATLAIAPNQVSASTGTVTYADGATTVWQTPAFKSVKRYVVKDQTIAIQGQKTVNGTTWYQIGAGEWIPEIYLQVEGATPAATSTANAATAKPTTTNTNTFAVQATYTEGAVTIWNSTSYTSASGKYLTSDSNMTAVATVQANGETWYKLSNGGYVPARYAAKAGSAQATATAATATKAATTATASTQAVATPAPTQAADTTNASTGMTADDTATTAANAAAATKTSTSAAATPAATPTQAATPAAPKASSTTTTATVAPKATTPATTATATPKTSTTTATASQSLTVTYTDSVVTEWKSAGYTQTAGKYLTSGTTVTAVGTTTANGETWYQLSDGNYVSARFFGTQGKANSSQAKAATTTPAATTQKTTTATPAQSQTSMSAATQANTNTASTSNTSASQASAQSTQSTTQAQATTTTSQNSQTTQTSTATPTNTVKQTTAASANGSRAARIAAVISVAKAQLGKPYVWGGKGPSSFDCSGLTHYAYLNGANKEIGGYTGAQEYAGTVVSIASLQVGDLVFWGSHGATYHVAIYLGGGQYIAAPQPGENVKISSISSYFAPSFGVRVL